jgi:hypothetical protein
MCNHQIFHYEQAKSENVAYANIRLLLRKLTQLINFFKFVL